MKRLWMGCSLLAAVACASIAVGATDADVDRSFFPYRTSVPAFPGVKPGLVIGKDNVEPFRNAVDPALYQHLKDGWLEIPVGPTTSLDLQSVSVVGTL